jgi:hypothetical protein
LRISIQNVNSNRQNSHSKLIKEIAQNLDCELDCYFNSETSELIFIPTDLSMVDDEDFSALYKQDLQKATTQNAGFKKFQAPESSSLSESWNALFTNWKMER